MSEKEETSSGILGHIRRLSRRLSGSFLDARSGPLINVHRDYRPIYAYDDAGHLRIGNSLFSISYFTIDYRNV